MVGSWKLGQALNGAKQWTWENCRRNSKWAKQWTEGGKFAGEKGDGNQASIGVVLPYTSPQVLISVSAEFIIGWE